MVKINETDLKLVVVNGEVRDLLANLATHPNFATCFWNSLPLTVADPKLAVSN